MADNFELLKAVEDYKTARQNVKAAQKITLEESLEAEKAHLGKMIVEARSNRGLTIDDIGLIIGIKNRTFIYDMINAHYRRQGPATVPNTTNDTTTDEPTPEYSIEYLEDSDTAVVTFSDDEIYYLERVEGTRQSFQVPEEWADHSKERRSQYKEILNSVREHFKS